MSAPLTLPQPIASYLARYVRLRRRHALLRASGLAAAFFLAWGLGCCMIDRLAWLAPVARLALLATGALAVAIIVFRPFAYWLSRDVNWRAAAAEIERSDARFGQRLRTVTSELLASPRQGGSREIIDALAREVGEVLTKEGPQPLLRWRPALLPWLGVLLLAGAAFTLTRFPAVGMPQLAARFATPLRPIPPVTTTRLTLSPPSASIVEGQPLRVTVSAERLTGPGVTLYYAATGSASWDSVPMTPTTTGSFEAVIASVTHDLRYLGRGGDARTVVGHARVLRKPRLTELRVGYTYPPYTNRAPLTVSNTDGLIEAPAGTEAALTLVASQALASAVLGVGDQKIKTTPTDDPRLRRASITVTKDQPYTLSLVSADQVIGSGPGTMMIRAIPDRPPLVRVVQPPGELRLSPRDILSLPFQAIDDYGVT
ncbi:MAG: DUF4175 domain-containing protein, partial [Planctomycetota bacterium]|nr:DUF4175 domain-containing protein [Planctomycetota bacterium]